MNVRTFRRLAKRGHAVIVASICTAFYALPLSTRANALLPQPSSAQSRHPTQPSLALSALSSPSLARR